MPFIIIRPNEKEISYKRKMNKMLKGEKGFDAFKFCGVIKIKEKPLEYQKRMRNEWE